MSEASPTSVLLVRTDAIGDNLLFSAILPHLAAHFAKARLTIVCSEHVAPLYEHCPFIQQVIPFNRTRAVADLQYRAGIVQKLRGVRADVCLNTIYSRDVIADEFALNCGAATMIAFRGSTDNMSSEVLAANNARYTRLVESSLNWWTPELTRLRDFLAAIGAGHKTISPQVWTTDDDRHQAAEIFKANDLATEKTIALFAGAQFNVRTYNRFGQALGEICRADQLQVVALGGESEAEINQQCLDDIGVRTVNLCGKTTLRQTAEILRVSRLAVGTETGLAHLACAVGKANVILVGGGHFGRFIPYSLLTSVVALPLECFGCNWRCRYLWPHCVKDVAPEVIELAVRQALSVPGLKTRVYFQDHSMWATLPGAPTWKPRMDLLNEVDCECTVVQAGSAGPDESAGPYHRIGVTRKFRQPFVQPWLSGVAKAVVRPIGRAMRRR